MADGATLIDEFISHGFDYFSGVPCSMLKGAFRRLEEIGPGEGTYLPAPREEVSAAAAAGAYLAGRNPVVLMQNSGLGYSLNTLTSLLLIYRIRRRQHRLRSPRRDTNRDHRSSDRGRRPRVHRRTPRRLRHETGRGRFDALRRTAPTDRNGPSHPAWHPGPRPR